GNPINTPDPLSKYKWYILTLLFLLLAAAAAFLLRKPATGTTAVAAGTAQALASPAAKNAALLNALKEELFALESDKIAGKITPAEYAELKAALETVLKRALKRQ
ncbi:MAG: carboxypeptidase regulatory-like domain-containing protein, partial [Terracidiphilus sp.]